MAKVLACPACEHKHPLDLLVGLESFVCKNCGRKLAVPPEANSPAQKVQKTREEPPEEVPIKEELPIEQVSVKDVASSQNDVVVLAHASLGLEEQKEKVVEPVARANASAGANADRSEDRKVAKSNQGQSILGSKKPSRGFFASLMDLSTLEIPLFARIAAWLFALPFGFFIVVLLPRFFKRGFHASDFVGVITNHGIGRYGIVVTLILLWSIATVFGILLFNLVFRRLFLQKRLANSNS